MKRLLETLAVLLVLGLLPAFAQSEYPAPDRDRDHDRAYSGQYQARMSSDDQKEFNENYDKWQKANAIASSNRDYHHDDVREFQGRFSKEDQKHFDEAYEHWVDHRRKNDRDDVAKDEGKMLEIMARYNIPRDVPYDALSSGARGH